MYLFFDTETSGLPKDYKAPATDHENWPRLVQLACLFYNDKGELLASHDFIIKPDGFEIPVEASSIHGITTEKALEVGMPLTDALYMFDQLCGPAEYLIAHNMSFDEKILLAEYSRTGMQTKLNYLKKICTKEETVGFCLLPSKIKYRYKWPKLTELHFKLFGYDFENAHNATVDVDITAKCFWELRKRGVL